MKNIFKFLGIAVFACGMMVSCGKENTEEGTDTTPVTPPAPTSSITVTFGSDSWEGTYALLYTGYVSDYNLIENRLFKTEGQLPYVDLVGSCIPGTYSAEITTSTQYPGTDSSYTYSNGTGSNDIYNLTVGNQTQVPASSGGYTGDWHILNANLNMKAFDLNTLTLSYELTAQMYDYYSWAYAIVNDVEDAEVRDLSVNVSNYTCENWTK